MYQKNHQAICVLNQAVELTSTQLPVKILKEIAGCKWQA